MLRRVSVPIDVTLGTVTKSPFKLISISAGYCGKLKGESVSKIMGTQRRDVPIEILYFTVMPLSYPFENQVDRPWREPAVTLPGRERRRAQKQRFGSLAGVQRPFLLQIVSQRRPGICRQEYHPLRLSFPLHPVNPRSPGIPKFLRRVWTQLVQIESNQFLPAQTRR